MPRASYEGSSASVGVAADLMVSWGKWGIDPGGNRVPTSLIPETGSGRPPPLADQMTDQITRETQSTPRVTGTEVH